MSTLQTRSEPRYVMVTGDRWVGEAISWII